MRRTLASTALVFGAGCVLACGGWALAGCGYALSTRWVGKGGLEKVEVRLIDTGDRATLEAWGQSDALFVDGRQVRTGPPPSQQKLARLIGKRVARLHTS